MQKNLSKQKVLDADPKEIQQINFTGNLDRVGDTAIFSYMNKQNKAILDFSQETMRVL